VPAFATGRGGIESCFDSFQVAGFGCSRQLGAFSDQFVAGLFDLACSVQISGLALLAALLVAWAMPGIAT
jgi:hypothetical protein